MAYKAVAIMSARCNKKEVVMSKQRCRWKWTWELSLYWSLASLCCCSWPELQLLLARHVMWLFSYSYFTVRTSLEHLPWLSLQCITIQFQRVSEVGTVIRTFEELLQLACKVATTGRSTYYPVLLTLLFYGMAWTYLLPAKRMISTFSGLSRSI